MSQFDDFLKEDFDGETPDAESRALLNRLAALEDAPAPAGLSDRVMRRVASEKRKDSPAAVPLFKRWAPVAAAVILVVAAVPLLLGQFGPDQPEVATQAPVQPEPVETVAQTPDPVEPARNPEQPVTVAAVSPKHYAPPEKVDAYFETWDAELADTMEAYAETEPLVAVLPEDSFGYYESPYEDPLSALVGF